MSNERREAAGGYTLMATALALAAEERDALEADLAEARQAIRRTLALLEMPLVPGRAAQVARLLRATLPGETP